MTFSFCDAACDNMTKRACDLEVGAPYNMPPTRFGAYKVRI